MSRFSNFYKKHISGEAPTERGYNSIIDPVYYNSRWIDLVLDKEQKLTEFGAYYLWLLEESFNIYY